MLGVATYVFSLRLPFISEKGQISWLGGGRLAKLKVCF
jgi:hypothetical protein